MFMESKKERYWQNKGMSNYNLDTQKNWNACWVCYRYGKAKKNLAADCAEA